MRPWVTVANAVSVDGRTTGFEVDMGQFYGLVGRESYDLHLTGADTMLLAADAGDEAQAEPADLAEPATDDERSLLGVVDSRGRLRNWHILHKMPYWRGAVALVAESTPAEYRTYLAQVGVTALCAGRERVDLGLALALLQERFGVQRVLVDSGGALSGALLAQGLVDELHVLVPPVLAAGEASLGFLHGRAGYVAPLTLLSCEAVEGGSLWVRYRVGA